MEKFVTYNLELHHIPGRNKMADDLSRYSNGLQVVEDFEILAPYVSNRSLRIVETGIGTKDPLVLSLAESGESDP